MASLSIPRRISRKCSGVAASRPHGSMTARGRQKMNGRTGSIGPACPSRVRCSASDHRQLTANRARVLGAKQVEVRQPLRQRTVPEFVGHPAREVIRVLRQQVGST
jgi:hypothetical protein